MRAFADPKLKARLADLGGTPFPGSPADFGKVIADETEKWGKVSGSQAPAEHKARVFTARREFVCDLAAS